MSAATDGLIGDVGSDCAAGRTIDGSGLLLLPGIVDIHGDAFERQMMPRPGVDVALDIALIDSDRQVIANGITTVFHGVTWSWEPGLRGADNARDILSTIEALRPQLAADTRFHLRHETFNLEAEAEVVRLGRRRAASASSASTITCRRLDSAAKRPDKIAQMVERSGHSARGFSRAGATAEHSPRRGARLDRAHRPKASRERRGAALARRCEPGTAALVPLTRMPGQRVSRSMSRPRREAATGGRSDRARRAQCDARQKPHGMGQRERHGRARVCARSWRPTITIRRH